VTSGAPDAPREIKRQLADYWDRRASDFDLDPHHVWQSDEERKAWEAILARLTGPRRGRRVLDVGSGTGFLALLVAEMGHDVTAIDMAPRMLAQAAQKASDAGLHIAFREADAERTGFPDASFDVVVSRHLIWNLPDPLGAVREWMRIARPGGRVGVINGVFSVNRQGWGEAYCPAFQRLPMLENVQAEQVAALLWEAGLQRVWTDHLHELVRIKRRSMPDYEGDRYLVAGTTLASPST